MVNMEETMMFKVGVDEPKSASAVIKEVYQAMEEKGYHPINQLVGYLLSGDPAYITSHKNARSLLRKFERDELLEELVRDYIKNNK